MAQKYIIGADGIRRPADSAETVPYPAAGAAEPAAYEPPPSARDGQPKQPRPSLKRKPK